MASEELSRRERQRLSHRREILDAALALFAEQGFHNISMQQVAEKAEFSIGSLYNYFKNKEDIYRSLLRELADAFHEATSEAIESGNDAVTKLRNYVVAMRKVFQENLVLIRLYHRETTGVGINAKAGVQAQIRTRHEHFLEVLAGIFEDGMNEGQFRRIAEPTLLAIALDGLIRSTLLRCLDEPECLRYLEDPEVPLNILFQGLLSTESE
ncbi:MAG TPA: TetR/AcrR family transcriptional regulator [Candidatus Krumholzibacteria bacterium]|nr:TetR/AcrR family transcriptional regulator [Candidatus Krumholzibacteria bacterium]